MPVTKIQHSENCKACKFTPAKISVLRVYHITKSVNKIRFRKIMNREQFYFAEAARQNVPNTDKSVIQFMNALL